MKLPEIFKHGAPMPNSMGMCADLYRDVRQLRLDMQKEVDEIKKRETEVQEHILNTLSKSDDTGVAGKRFRAQVVTKRRPTISAVSDESPQGGWAGLTSWIKKHDRFDMLQRRLSDKAVMDWAEENGRSVPGTEIIIVPSLSVTKI